MLGSRADSLCALGAPNRASLGGVEPTCLSQKQHFCWSSSVTGPLAAVRERTVGYETRGWTGPQGCTQETLSCGQPRSSSVCRLFLSSDTTVHAPPPKRFLVRDQAETVLNTFLGFHKSLCLTEKIPLENQEPDLNFIQLCEVNHHVIISVSPAALTRTLLSGSQGILAVGSCAGCKGHV